MSAVTAIALDIGLKRIGIAVGNSLAAKASPAGLLSANDFILPGGAFNKIVQQWNPQVAVVGQVGGENRALINLQKRIKHLLEHDFRLCVVEIDETLTTHEANRVMAEQKIRSKKKPLLRDQVAACLILESYFNSL